MKKDELERLEKDAQDIIEALGELSYDTQASPEFLGKVMAQAEQLQAPRPGLLSRVKNMFVWPSNTGVGLAFATVLVIAVIGAVPQYFAWINTYLMGISPDASNEIAAIQEKLWEKNEACAEKIDPHSDRYASIDGEPSVTVWAGCPSGDVLVDLRIDDGSEPKVINKWISLEGQQETAKLFEVIVPKAYATHFPKVDKLFAASIVKILCQERLSKNRIKRRVKLSNGRCYDEVIDTRTGKLKSRKKAPCNRDC